MVSGSLLLVIWGVVDFSFISFLWGCGLGVACFGILLNFFFFLNIF